VNFPRHVVETQEYPREDWDRVLLVIHVRHEPAESFIDEISKVLVPDAGHPVAHHTHGHARVELQAEEDAIEEGERRAERVTYDRDG
jgi:hypothetical protein